MRAKPIWVKILCLVQFSDKINYFYVFGTYCEGKIEWNRLQYTFLDRKNTFCFMNFAQILAVEVTPKSDTYWGKYASLSYSTIYQLMTKCFECFYLIQIGAFTHKNTVLFCRGLYCLQFAWSWDSCWLNQIKPVSILHFTNKCNDGFSFLIL